MRMCHSEASEAVLLLETEFSLQEEECFQLKRQQEIPDRTNTEDEETCLRDSDNPHFLLLPNPLCM